MEKGDWRTKYRYLEAEYMSLRGEMHDLRWKLDQAYKWGCEWREWKRLLGHNNCTFGYKPMPPDEPEWKEGE